MRASSKLVWVSLCLLCETFGVWSYAQGNNGNAPSPRQARRDVQAVDGWPTFMDSQSPKAIQDFGGVDAAAGARHSALRANGMEQFDLAKTVAQVGDQYILKGELIADANLLLAKTFAQLEQLPEAERNQARKSLLASRDLLVEQLLQQAIERKLMYLEFLRTSPVLDEKKKEEAWKKMRKTASEIFDKQLAEMAKKVRDGRPEQYQSLVRDDYQLFRIAVAMKDANIESPGDPRLEQVLRDNGTSLYSQQTAFMERVLGKQSVGRSIDLRPEITHEQMLAYYREHLNEWQVQTRARWEQMTVLFSRTKNKVEAWDLMVDMGNQMVFGGAEFMAVARKQSHEKNAERGGYHDWTTLGDLRISKELSAEIFTIELNKLSKIIEDDEGLHIIRVLEREEAHLIPFTDAQTDIKTNLKNETLNKSYRDYVDKLREKTPIWTADKGYLPRNARSNRATDETQMKHR